MSVFHLTLKTRTELEDHYRKRSNISKRMCLGPVLFIDHKAKKKKGKKELRLASVHASVLNPRVQGFFFRLEVILPVWRKVGMKNILYPHPNAS